MTETLVAVSPPSPKKSQDPGDPGGPPPGEAFGPIPDAGPERELTPAELAVIKQMVLQAKDAGVALTGPDGLLKALTKTVIETALDEELSEHLGYDKHAVEGRNRGNSRNGTRTKTVLTDNCGPVQITVPRDRDGTFEPQLVKKRQRRLSGFHVQLMEQLAAELGGFDAPAPPNLGEVADIMVRHCQLLVDHHGDGRHHDRQSQGLEARAAQGLQVPHFGDAHDQGREQ